MKNIIFLILILPPCLLFAGADKTTCRDKDANGNDISKTYIDFDYKFKQLTDKFKTLNQEESGKVDHNKKYIMKLVGSNCSCSNDISDYDKPKKQIKYNTHFIFSLDDVVCKILLNDPPVGDVEREPVSIGDYLAQGLINVTGTKIILSFTSLCTDICANALDKQKSGNYSCKITNDKLGVPLTWNCNSKKS